MIREYLDLVLFSISGKEFTAGAVSFFLLLTVFIIFMYHLTKRKVFREFLSNNEVEKHEIKTFYYYVRLFIMLLLLLAGVNLLGLNYSFFTSENINFNVGLIISGLLIINAARIIDWVISNLLVHNYYSKNELTGEAIDNRPSEVKMTRWVKMIIYIFAAFLILRNFVILDLTLFHTQYQDNNFDFKISNILSAILVMLVARLLIALITQLILVGVYQSNKIELGAQIALNQLITYVIFVIAGIIALNYLGFNMTLIWGGAAALLVGLGLGLQQTFNDLFSGILLLFERSVTVGDVLKFDDQTFGTVKRIGLRTTLLQTRGNESLIVPNSQIATNKIDNLTHSNNKVRFDIRIGVAYGSDTHKVKSLLLKAIKNNPYILEYPAPFVRFIGFGDSSLDFQVFFFSRNLLVIEDIKSDIRFDIEGTIIIRGLDYNDMDCGYQITNCETGDAHMNCEGAGLDKPIKIISKDEILVGDIKYTRVTGEVSQ